MQGVQDKVILVTGASSGIGEATARHLAELGAKVVLGARRTDRLEAIVKELTAAGRSATAVQLDVTSLDSMKAFVKTALDAHGRIDVVLNNAGLMPLSKLEALKVDEWDRMIDVNIRGVLHGIAATLPHFKKQGSGHVINVSSVAGHIVFPAAAVYCATKFAVGAISEGLRMENKDIRVTVISPGAIATELGDHITDADAAKGVKAFTDIAIPADAIARGVAYAVAQPADVDVNEIIIRPVRQEL